jgi:SOS-response transcriptional repressor LexA
MPPIATARGEYRVFSALGEPCGVFLWSPSGEQSDFLFRRDWDKFAGQEADVLKAIAEDLPGKLSELGPEQFLRWADETLSNTFRVSEPLATLVGRFEPTLQTLYRANVQSKVQEYKTHLPLYSIRAAAGGFGKDMAASAEDWIEVRVPGRRDLTDDLFLVRISGRSMEPDIPDGSLCLFRSYYGGSRKGGIYLVQRIASSEDGGELTIKRYDSSKRESESGWEHKGIRMKPDNPEFEEWDLREDERYVTIAQFLSVLDEPSLGA